MKNTLVALFIITLTFIVSACGAADTEDTSTKTVLEALYSQETGIMLMEENEQAFIDLGVENAMLDIVVDGETYTLFEDKLPELFGEYPLMVTGEEVATLSIIGSPVIDTTGVEGQGIYCWDLYAVGCCSAGANMRQQCYNSATGNFWHSYRCTSGPC